MFGVGCEYGDFRFLAALGITMALPSHTREMKMVGLAPLDSGLRRNDGLAGLDFCFHSNDSGLGMTVEQPIRCG